MESGNSAATSSGPSGAANAVALRKSMRGCWRRESEVRFILLNNLVEWTQKKEKC